MSFWIELHCDKQAAKDCYSFSASNPGDMTDNSFNGVNDMRNKLIEIALSKGWKRISGNQYACPRCAKAEK